MIKISAEQMAALREAGLIKDKIVHGGNIVQQNNYTTANKTHKGRAKTYYVVEEFKIMKFLGLIRGGFTRRDRDVETRKHR